MFDGRVIAIRRYPSFEALLTMRETFSESFTFGHKCRSAKVLFMEVTRIFYKRLLFLLGCVSESVFENV